MNTKRLNEILADQPKYRWQQAERAIYVDLVSEWSEATVLPAALRQQLAEECPLAIDVEESVSADGSQKALITLEDDLKIETVLLKHKDGRHTVCVSSQVGCPLGCLFCATGRLGYKRNLSAEEIVEQVLYFARQLKKQGKQVTNVVFMGMGEPLLNYDNVLSAIRTLNRFDGFNLGARRMSISTAGIPKGIRQLSREGLEVNLALSLHAPNNELRGQIMPISKNYTLTQVMTALAEYIEATNRRVMFEYVMIKNINDAPEHAKQLVKLLSGWLAFVNLINYNETELFYPSTKERIDKFKKILEDGHITVVQRHGFGQGIDAACGQLAAKRKAAKPQKRNNTAKAGR
ncbi:23S rRNA (adenine(2503)-C(2))-methyltransferase RlmN [Candidatus Falkowbacteria bacterium]|nr:23S rRNA (adenine(2503)-C(2))-methyltransferase RlmN [Candidatus Falkowbacteria bacterium]